MSEPTSGASTPNPRFTSQNNTAEDLLKSQTVGLVNLDDFRKRRAEALEQKERERQSGASTPTSQNAHGGPFKKKRKANVAKGKLSFGVDGEDEEDSEASSAAGAIRAKSNTPNARERANNASAQEDEGDVVVKPRKKLGPNALLGNAPKAMTKSALAKDAQTREQLRLEFLEMRERVKATEIMLPFVFYDGTNIPGGRCKVKKGEHVWLFLDKARKVGAEHGAGSGDKGKKEWARVGVDDLMLVRGDIIVPHHYEFYYFLINKTLDFSGQRLFPFSSEPTAATPATISKDNEEVDTSTYDPLARPKKDEAPTAADDTLEGAEDDPSLTKVVDRRWYERNKHIFPASIWEDFDPAKDYSKGIRKDAEGNSYFFS